MKKLIHLLIVLFLVLSQTVSFGQPPKKFKELRTYLASSPFKTSGKQLLDPCGNPIILKGVNKMVYFDQQDPDGSVSFPQIALTGANCVRIVWQMRSDDTLNPVDSNTALLDKIIANAKINKLIPIVGLWDYTNKPDGGFSKLDEHIAYWTKPDVLALIAKYRNSLIINIANEAGMSDGNEYNPDSLNKFVQVYKEKVNLLRQAGIKVPLMIDGIDRGKSLHGFAVKGQEMVNNDPLHNLIFSFHPYWPKSYTDVADNGNFIRNKFAEVANLPIPIVMGEIAKYGAWSPSGKFCEEDGLVDYRQFVQIAHEQGIGWMVWEWGSNKKDCPALDMTSDGMFSSLGQLPDGANLWTRELALDASYSIKKTAQRTFFINNKFLTCLRKK